MENFYREKAYFTPGKTGIIDFAPSDNIPHTPLIHDQDSYQKETVYIHHIIRFYQEIYLS